MTMYFFSNYFCKRKYTSAQTFNNPLHKNKNMKKALFIIIGSTFIACSGNAETPSDKEAITPAELQTEANAVPQVGYVDLTYAAEQSVNAVVYIKVTQMGKTHKVTYHDPFAEFFGDMFGHRGISPQQREYKEPDRRGAGSGVIISQDGYIVTNNHVVAGADEILVKLNDNREFSGRIVGLDANTDLALIKIEGKNLPTLPIGNSDELKIGQWVLAVGNPFNLTSTVTAGIVSAKARSLGANGIESFIQTDAAINQGNSGGALVNAQGELVGINAMLYSQTGSYSGYGFAIPTSIMNKVVADLKAYGTVQRAVLGVTGIDVTNYIDAEKAQGKTPDLGTLTGVWVNSVAEGSTAAEAGLQKGDAIVSLNDKEIHKMSELQEALSQYRPGDKVKLTWIRDKKKHTESVTLKNSQGSTKILQEVDVDEMGVALEPLSADEKTRLGIPYGLTVKAIRNGKMQKAGVAKGTIILAVNDMQMETPQDWENAVKQANQSPDRTIWIKAIAPSGRKQGFVIDLNE